MQGNLARVKIQVSPSNPPLENDEWQNMLQTVSVTMGEAFLRIWQFRVWARQPER